jgi:hypothetical protein
VPPTAVVHDRDLVDTVGPWRPASDTGLLDPDSDLWARMAAVVGPPLWVRRITNVKMAAALRRNVYRDRPHHEQEHWLQRIREADDPEALMRDVARLEPVVPEVAAPDPVVPEVAAPDPARPRRRPIRSLHSWLAPRARLRNGGRLPPAPPPPAPPPPPPPPSPQTAQERWQARRRFKGLDH